MRQLRRGAKGRRGVSSWAVRAAILLACTPLLSQAETDCKGPVECSRLGLLFAPTKGEAKPALNTTDEGPTTALSVHPGLAVEFRNSTFTLARLSPESADNFSYVPVDGLFGLNRTLRGFHALGDLSLRVRAVTPQQLTLQPPAILEAYPIYLTATTASHDPVVPLKELPHQPWEFISHDVTPQLGYPPEFPLKLTRTYAQAWDEAGGLLMSYTLHNSDPFNALEVGALSFPLVFQGRWDGFSLEDMAHSATFIETSLGGHQGWASVTRMTGRDEVLMVLPENGTSFEAWRPAREDAGNANTLWSPHWMVHSKAYQETEWLTAEAPWNRATSLVLPPGGNHTVGLRFLLANSLRNMDTTLLQAGKAVVHGVPGYVLATDMASAQILVTPPQGSAGIEKVAVEPKEAIAVGPPRRLRGANNTWSVPLRGLKPRRARLLLTYKNVSGFHSVHYHVLPPFRQQVARFGGFLSEKAWLGASEPYDPFGRSFSAMPWDRDARKHVMQDPRLYVVGLSDEAGAAQNMALGAMAHNMPTPQGAARLDDYINKTLWGVKTDVPFPVSLQDHKTGGIAASLFWVPTPNSTEARMPNYTYEAYITSGWVWNFDRAVKAYGRAYNYPHQVSVYWAMYRLTRNHDLVAATEKPLWYLSQAAFTIKAMWFQAQWYTQFGLMAGTVFREVLQDLRLEGLSAVADEVEGIMSTRLFKGIHYPSSGPCPEPPGGCACTYTPSNNLTVFDCPAWKDLPFPFGSEFAWDSTGQEEIYVWSKFFGVEDVAASVLDAVLAFTPNLPHWAYQGSALGVGDFSNNARNTPYGGWERVLLHYRAGLNAIPLLEAFRENPSDVGLLERGLGAVAGQLTSIDERGAPSMGLHADPGLLRHDPYSGDFGVGFFGHSLNSASYVLFGAHGAGWLCYLCDLVPPPGAPFGGFDATLDSLSTPVMVLPRDSFHRKVFVEPLGVYLVSDAGTLQSVLVDIVQGLLNVTFEPLAEQLTSRLRLRVQSPSGASNALNLSSIRVSSCAPLSTAPPPDAAPPPGASAEGQGPADSLLPFRRGSSNAAVGPQGGPKDPSGGRNGSAGVEAASVGLELPAGMPTEAEAVGYQGARAPAEGLMTREGESGLQSLGSEEVLLSVGGVAGQRPNKPYLEGVTGEGLVTSSFLLEGSGRVESVIRLQQPRSVARVEPAPQLVVKSFAQSMLSGGGEGREGAEAPLAQEPDGGHMPGKAPVRLLGAGGAGQGKVLRTAGQAFLEGRGELSRRGGMGQSSEEGKARPRLVRGAYEFTPESRESAFWLLFSWEPSEPR